MAGFNSAVSASFDLIPVNVITGFLGSGKTTLLQKLLVSDLAGETAVLVNEFGEVGIDHLLVREVAPNIVLLSSGCVCCSIRGDLKDALVQLFSRRQKGDIPFMECSIWFIPRFTWRHGLMTIDGRGSFLSCVESSQQLSKGHLPLL